MLPIFSDKNKIEKGWGYEIIFANNKNYCGKILHFNPNSKMSMHYHMKKEETWYVNQGSFIFRWINTKTTKIEEKILKIGDSTTIIPGLPHQLETNDGGEIFEVSTEHFDNDSYRIFPGDSQ